MKIGMSSIFLFGDKSIPYTPRIYALNNSAFQNAKLSQRHEARLPQLPKSILSTKSLNLINGLRDRSDVPKNKPDTSKKIGQFFQCEGAMHPGASKMDDSTQLRKTGTVLLKISTTSVAQDHVGI